MAETSLQQRKKVKYLRKRTKEVFALARNCIIWSTTSLQRTMKMELIIIRSQVAVQ